MFVQCQDLNRQVVQSQYAAIRIPVLDFEAPPKKGGKSTGSVDDDSSDDDERWSRMMVTMVNNIRDDIGDDFERLELELVISRYPIIYFCYYLLFKDLVYVQVVLFFVLFF